MGWPKGRERPRKVKASDEQIVSIAPEPISEECQTTASGEKYPSDWRKGALLNVRNRGDAYVITLYPAEYEPEHPERAMRFTNLGECQDFVSKWYAADHHDPRAR